MGLSVSDLDLFIKNRKRSIAKLDPVKLFEGVQNALIIGSGTSAQPEQIESIAKDYDLVITINNAMHIYPEANYYSFEFDFKHQNNIPTQLGWINEVNYRKFLIKPFCLAKLSQGSWDLILNRDWEIGRCLSGTASQGGDRAVLLKPSKKVKHLKALRHGRLLKQKPSEMDYLRLIQKRRIPIQWRGSLSMWLDVIHLAEVEHVGLIGTDLHSGYSPHGNPFNVTLEEVHGTNEDLASLGGRASLLNTLSFLAKNGYLGKTRFSHFHSNQELASLI